MSIPRLLYCYCPLPLPATVITLACLDHQLHPASPFAASTSGLPHLCTPEVAITPTREADVDDVLLRWWQTYKNLRLCKKARRTQRVGCEVHNSSLVDIQEDNQHRRRIGKLQT
ncbi:hypothetical protein K523DRAFT_109717 [Schizophyllum commune Tattone D]|nr:hypothetical protein K523DRAFT_109717 [Schizophyllum commune Tattone D]